MNFENEKFKLIIDPKVVLRIITLMIKFITLLTGLITTVFALNIY